MNPFDKLWFDDVKQKFKNKNYDITYNINTFTATKKYDKTHRYKIELLQNKIIVIIPLEKDYEYKTEFTEYYKVANYLLYHLNDDVTPLINNYEFIDNRDIINLP